jgi:fructose-1,6-bisphosphatase/inositol monophosphatase family enzyme
MTEATFHCPLLKKDIVGSFCLNITYAAEGRISQAVIPEIDNWDFAKDVCADCGNAYWNKNNMEPPVLKDLAED